MDTPVELAAGISEARERKWGVIGGLVGSGVGVGSAAIAIGIDGASVSDTGLFPSIFRTREILALDVYFLAVLLTGAAFSAAALALARRSPYPRTEAYGAGLTGWILSSIAGLVLFVRLMALLSSL
jgi:hypothetical protein